MSTSLVLDESLQIGLPAEVFFSAKNTAFADASLPYGTECLRGIASITPKREPKLFEGGVPLTTLKSLTYKEGGTFKFETGSLTMEMLERAMGGGTLATVAANGSATFTNIQVQLTGTGVVQLPFKNIASMTVTSNDATPISRSDSTDYTADLTNGTIVRKTTGLISSGDIVLCSGTYSAPRKKTWSFGGETNRYYYAAKVLFAKDNDKLQWVDLYKMYPKGEISIEYKGDDWNTYTIEFDLAKDTSRTAGDQILKVHDETDEA